MILDLYESLLEAEETSDAIEHQTPLAVVGRRGAFLAAGIPFWVR